MAKETEEQIDCRTPAEGKDGATNIPSGNSICCAMQSRKVLGAAGAGGDAEQGPARPAVGPLIAREDLARLGKLGWHVVSVRLELEVRGEIDARCRAKGPLRIALV